MSKLFEINELFDSINTPIDNNSSIAIEKFQNMHFEKVESLKQLMGRIPEDGEIFFLWTKNSFNAFTFITYVIKYFGIVKELNFSTYAINERILSSMVKWYDKGAIKSIYICISDSIRSRVPKINNQLQTYANERDITIGYSWNHSKVTLIKTANHHFVICGSGNFSENAMNEQYTFTDNEKLFNFYRGCIRGTTE